MGITYFTFFGKVLEGEWKKKEINECWLPDPAQFPGFYVSIVGEGLILRKVKPGLGKCTSGEKLKSGLQLIPLLRCKQLRC